MRHVDSVVAIEKWSASELVILRIILHNSRISISYVTINQVVDDHIRATIFEYINRLVTSAITRCASVWSWLRVRDLRVSEASFLRDWETTNDRHFAHFKCVSCVMCFGSVVPHDGQSSWSALIHGTIATNRKFHWITQSCYRDEIRFTFSIRECREISGDRHVITNMSYWCNNVPALRKIVFELLWSCRCVIFLKRVARLTNK